ncbi:PA2817 family protein [Marinimicrobium alkaliphilum]|uniref:PA2817 family protein n=1 Tax=Marinimicrobium alkaliphilum TaxID=2202654 RepID=UPI001E64B235|nr:PA2817 family protein [Marinimicrobium alkaliphilum]
MSTESLYDPSTEQDALYQQYHLRLTGDLILQIQQQPPFILDTCEETDLTFLARLEALPGKASDGDFQFEGQQLLCRIITAYPHLTPLIHRDLLWFFGGDCLHYMPDEEIARYQLLDERRAEAQAAGRAFSYSDERAKILGFH